MSSDRFPLPPADLQFLMSARADDDDAFLAIGRGCAAGLIGSLRRATVPVERLRSILDFGCGCGRVIRHISWLPEARLHGSDYNLRLVAWCGRNLPFGRFSVNGAAPPLAYPDGAFDLVYSFSVFTHLPEDRQQAWFHELARVLEPGGHLLVTTHGEAYVHAYLAATDRQRFAAGELVVHNPHVAGRNDCSVYHPAAYLRERLAPGLEPVLFLPGKVLDASCGMVEQDVHLLRKPG